MRGYAFSHPAQVDAVNNNPHTGTKWSKAFEIARLALYNAALQTIDTDVSFLFDQIGSQGVDNLVYLWKDAATLTVQTGMAVSDDGEATYALTSATDIAVSSVGASQRGVVWIGQETTTGGTVFRVNATPATPPADLLHPHRLRWFFETDSSGQLVVFTASKGTQLGVGCAVDYHGLNRPLDCLPKDGAQYSRTHPLFAALYAEIGQMYDAPFTANAATDLVTTTTTLSLAAGDACTVWASADGALPTPLAANTTYYVRDKSGNSCKLAATVGGAAIDLTTNGTAAVMTIADAATFSVPDERGRARINAGQGSGLSNRVIGQRMGEEAHANSLDENAPHAHVAPEHSHTIPSHVHVGGAHSHGEKLGNGTGAYIYGSGSNPTISNAGGGSGTRIKTDLDGEVITSESGALTSDTTGNTATTSSGSGAAHNTMQPSLVVGAYIKY